MAKNKIEILIEAQVVGLSKISKVKHSLEQIGNAANKMVKDVQASGRASYKLRKAAIAGGVGLDQLKSKLSSLDQVLTPTGNLMNKTTLEVDKNKNAIDRVVASVQADIAATKKLADSKIYAAETTDRLRKAAIAGGVGLDKLKSKLSSLDQVMTPTGNLMNKTTLVVDQNKNAIDRVVASIQADIAATKKLSQAKADAIKVTSHLTRLGNKFGVGAGKVKSQLAGQNLEMMANGKIVRTVTHANVDQIKTLSNLKSMNMRATIEQGNSTAMLKKSGEMNISVDQLRQSMAQLNMALGKNGQLYSTISGKPMKDQKAAQAQLTGATKRFKMELLSVMFFGMAVAKMFGALTRGSLEASGAQSIWSTMTMMIGLPAAMDMTNMLLKLYSAYDKLPGGMKRVVSWSLFVGQGMASALMSFGMFGLGLQGLATQFPKLTAFFKNFGKTAATVATKTKKISFWGKLGKTIKGPFGPLLIAVGGFAVGFKEEFGHIREYVEVMTEGVKNIFGGFIQFFVGMTDALGALIQGDADGFLEGLKTMVSGFGNFILGVIQLVLGFIGGLAEGALRGVVGIFKTIGGLMDKLHIPKWLQYMIMPVGSLMADTINDNNKDLFMQTPVGPVLNPTKLASGGIVNRPTTALIGEAGPEAVIPLGRGGGIGNNINFNPEIHITTGSISNNVDINSLARKVSEMLYADLRGLGVR